MKFARKGLAAWRTVVTDFMIKDEELKADELSDAMAGLGLISPVR
jgi:hypothetical protein